MKKNNTPSDIQTFLSESLASSFDEKSLQKCFDGFQIQRKVVFRINPLKGNLDGVMEECKRTGISIQPLPYLRSALSLENATQKKLLEKLECYKNGEIYLQSFASQLPVSFLEGSQDALTILDATAAPGGKTSQLSALFPESTIYAVEKSKVRYEKMCHNLKKMGIHNVIPLYGDITILSKQNPLSSILFDIIITDVPCSGEGNVCFLYPKTYAHFLAGYQKHFYSIQKNILSAVVPLLKEGGELLYSTCTLNIQENEAIVHFLLSNFPLETVDIASDFLVKSAHFGIEACAGNSHAGKSVFRKDVTHTFHLFPTQLHEGFYVAKMKKV